MKLISDLDELDVLREEDVDVTEGQLLEALAAAKQLESELAAMGNQNQKAKEKHEKKHEKSSGPWYWAVRLEQGSSDKLLEVWQASEDGVKAAGWWFQVHFLSNFAMCDPSCFCVAVSFFDQIVYKGHLSVEHRGLKCQKYYGSLPLPGLCLGHRKQGRTPRDDALRGRGQR